MSVVPDISNKLCTWGNTFYHPLCCNIIMINFKPVANTGHQHLCKIFRGKTPDMVIVADFFKPLIDYVSALIWNQSTF